MVLLHIILYIRVCGLALNDETKFGHLGDGHFLAGKLFYKVLRHDAQERVPVEGLYMQVPRAGCGKKSEIHDSVADPVTDVVVGPLEHFDLDRGIQFAEGFDDVGHPARADTGENAHFHCALFEAVELGHSLLQALLAVEDRVDIGHQVLAVTCQRHSRFLSCKNREAQFLLHGRNSVAYRGRCQADQIRGLVKTAGFRDCLKNLITEKRHESPPIFCLILIWRSGTEDLPISCPLPAGRVRSDARFRV